MPKPADSAAAAASRQVAPDTIECAKPGRFRSMSGEVVEFSAQDLAATARAYSKSIYRAPLVVGHPKIDAPAYGWIGGMRFEDGSLEALPEQVNPAFAAAVNDGSLGKISLKLWKPDSVGNPCPGVYYPIHLGFLGAAEEAIKGLRQPSLPVAFSQPLVDDADTVEFSSEWDDVDNASLWRGLRDWLLGKFGQDEADKAVPPYLVASVERGAQQEVADAAAEANDTGDGSAMTGPAFASPRSTTPPETLVTPAEKAAILAENDRLKQQLADQAAAARKARLDAAHADTVAFADGLVSQARLAVAERDLVVAALDALAERAEDAGAVLMFGQGESAAPVLPAFKSLLAKLPPGVKLGRVATTAATSGAEPKLLGNVTERRAALAQMFPDLEAGA